MEDLSSAEEFFWILKRLGPPEVLEKLGPETMLLLARFAELLERWSPHVDLISLTTRELLISRHIVDCILAWFLIRDDIFASGSGDVLDVGSGAGLPGVVISILEPSRRVMLCEPREKRVVFLEECRRQLGLPNLAPVRSRFESLPGECISSPSIVITRATGLGEQLYSLTRRLLKSPVVVAEMTTPGYKPIPESGVKTLSYELPPDRARRLLMMTKI